MKIIPSKGGKYAVIKFEKCDAPKDRPKIVFSYGTKREAVQDRKIRSAKVK